MPVQYRTFPQALVHLSGHTTEDGVDQDDVRAALQIQERCGWLKDLGWVIRPWLASAKSPFAKRERWDGHTFWTREHHGFLDHTYVLYNPKTKVKKFCAEPYHIIDDDLDALQGLREKGWEVFISTRMAIHYPGQTIRIEIQREHKRKK